MDIHSILLLLQLSKEMLNYGCVHYIANKYNNLIINLISMLMIKYSILKIDTHGLHTNLVYICAYIYIYIAKIKFLV
jgi:hypothetical protein